MMQATAVQAISPLALVLTSAGIAAAVTSLITLFGQWVERRSRRENCCSRKRSILQTQKIEVAMKVAGVSGDSLEAIDAIYSAEIYYKWMVQLMDKGALPDEAHQRLEASRKRNISDS
jgi:hypothetical protein